MHVFYYLVRTGTKALTIYQRILKVVGKVVTLGVIDSFTVGSSTNFACLMSLTGPRRRLSFKGRGGYCNINSRKEFTCVPNGNLL